MRAPSGATQMHSHVCSIVHVVFGTKQRMQLIPAAVQPRLWNYLAGIARNHHIQALAVGGTEDHVHLLLRLPPDMALSDAVRTLKANSSRLMRENSPSFTWQEGYGGFSVSPPQVDGVRRYIANQAAHHHRQSYDEELAAMLRAANFETESCAAPEGARGGKGDR